MNPTYTAPPPPTTDGNSSPDWEAEHRTGSRWTIDLKPKTVTMTPQTNPAS